MRGGELSFRARMTAALALVIAGCACAPAFAQSETGPIGPFAGYSVDPAAFSETEQVPDVPQPDWWQLPSFNVYFGSGMYNPSFGRYESVAVGPDSAGDPRVYVASSTTDRVYAYDGDVTLGVSPALIRTFGTEPGPATLQDAAGIAYYRGEVFVVDRYLPNPGQDRVVVYDADGNYRRSFPLINPGGIFDMAGVDVMANEVWVTGELCGGLGGVIEIYDARTGALKAIIPHVGHSPTPDPTKPCDESADPSSWWDMSVVPELNGAIAQYRLVNRGLLPQLSLPDADIACLTCFRRLYQDGTNAVWGMHWFLTVDGSTASTRGSAITEYGIDPDPTTGERFLQERRRWAPKQASTGGVRDVAYQSRDTRIDWNGHLTEHEWQHGNQCLEYVISDGDIFVVGAQGEHYYELARGFTKIEFSIDGQVVQSIGSPTSPPPNPGTFCWQLDGVNPSGPHTLTAKAWTLGGSKVVTATNDLLRVDHDPPTGSVDPLARYVDGTVGVSGQMADAHSGPLDWQLQVQPAGGAWSNLCGSSTQPDAAGKHHCDWNTRSVADGQYYLKGIMRDNVKAAYGGANTAATPSVGTYVDNTPPGIALSGELWDRRDHQTIWFDEAPQLTMSATDAGSGVKNIEILVDGARSDFVEQGCDPGGCGLSRTYTFNPSVYLSSGDHTITVNSTDQLGQTSSTSWTVHVEAQSEADMPQPAPADAQPSSQPIGDPKPDDTAAPPPDEDYGGGNLDDYCNPDPDTPSTDCTATVYDPTPDEAGAGTAAATATAATPDLPAASVPPGTPSAAVPPDLGGASVAAAGPSIYLQPGHSGWGLSDQTGTTFDDSRFTDLGVTKVRLIVPYDLIPQRGARPDLIQETDGWIGAATRASKRILISFSYSGVDRSHVPTVKEYSHAVRQFMARYPQVKEFTPWNEPNFAGDALSTHPYRAGQLWRNLNWRCQNVGCTVAAGDFADRYFTPDYLTNYLNGAGHLPPRWAWHAYQDGHQFSPNGGSAPIRLNRFLKATTYKNHAAPGVWLTEQGGRVSTGGDLTKYGLARANQDFAYMLTLPNVSSRIRRFYAYQWKGDGNWDSGLIDYQTDATRQMYRDYKAKTNP
jgi:hypothetical protein